MGIKKSDAEFTEPFVGTTEVIVMMSVQGGRSTSSAVRLDYNAVHALEKAIVDYTFLDDTPQTESTGSPIGDYRDGVGAWQTERMTEEEIDTMLAKALVGQTDCGWK